MSTTEARRIDVFFYGLFMDESILRAKQVDPRNRRIASIENFSLRIAERATLVPHDGDVVYGVVFSLTHDELAKLYDDPSVRDYKPQAVFARLRSGATLPALCFNLPYIPPGETNLEYVSKLRELASQLGFPDEYVSLIK